MSAKNLQRLDAIKRLLRQEITGPKAAALTGLCLRHLRRLKKRVDKTGANGLLHRSIGKPGNRRMPEKEKNKIVKLIKTNYADFGPTFAAEKLAEHHDVTRDPKTIRLLMTSEKLWHPKPRRGAGTHREWRARKDTLGEMQQFDGSYHDWFEGRGSITEACLLASIDDATGKITRAEFAAHEGVFPVFAFWKAYILDQGKPRLIYLDRFSTYKVNHKVAKENPDVKTQFERAMRELGIELITAHSPEAKGRVERLFQTLQDRLVKEMRLRNICDIETANRFLADEFIPKIFNVKFAVRPKSSADLHRELTKEETKNIDAIFSRQETRIVRNDFTVSFQNRWYQLIEKQPATVCKRDEVTIEERLDAAVMIRLRGKYLNFTPLPERPKKVAATPWVIAKTSSALPRKPAPDHPWRRTLLPGQRRIETTNEDISNSR